MNVFLNGKEYTVNLAFNTEDVNDVALLSSGKYKLLDNTGARLIASPMTYTEPLDPVMISNDEVIIKDSDGTFLNHKEDE